MSRRSLLTPRRGLTLLAALVAMGLGACDKSDNRTAGEKVDAAVARTEQAAGDAKARTEQLASEAKAKTESAATTVGQKIDDAAITASVSAGLAKDADLSAIRINVDTKDGAVVLRGPAPTVQAKARAEAIAKGVQGVVSVDNQLEVKTM